MWRLKNDNSAIVISLTSEPLANPEVLTPNYTLYIGVL